MLEGPVRILVVDDNPGDVCLLNLLLKSWPKSQVIVIDHGNSAMNLIEDLDAIRDTPAPDLILLDVNLPGVDGLAILSRLRLSWRLHDTPVAILTSSMDASTRKRALACGADRFFPKPSTFDELVQLGTKIENLYMQHLVKKSLAS